jgi:hypothetical protein
MSLSGAKERFLLSIIVRAIIDYRFLIVAFELASEASIDAIVSQADAS